MPTGSDGGRPRLFVSFNGDVESRTWVTNAGDLLRNYFEVYDYRKEPVVDADLPEALKFKVSDSDVFICLFSKDYHENPTAKSEFDAAVERSTGAVGSLAKQKHRPLVYVITFDTWAESWIREHHPGFSYIAKEACRFGGDRFLPVDAGFWDHLRDNIMERLEVLDQAEEVLDQAERSGDQATTSSATTENPPNFAMLGRPNPAFETAIRQACKDAISDLGDTLNLGSIPDGWADRDGSNRNAKDPQTSRAVLGVAKGGPRSALVQPCDLSVLDDVRDEDQGALGEGFKRHLKKIRCADGSRVADEDVKIAVARTLFWVPRVGDPKIDPIEGTTPVASLSEIKPGSDGPWLGASTPIELAAWIRLRESNPSLKVKTELYTPEIAPQLETGLQKSYTDPVNLTMIPIERIPLAIEAALKEGSKILVAVFDNDVRVNQSVIDAIKVKIKNTDKQIYAKVGDTSGRRVARAVFLIRFPARVPESIVPGGGKNWILVPLDRSTGFLPPEDRIHLINEQLGR